MEVLGPFCNNIKSINLFRPTEPLPLTDASSADLLKCGSCSTEFLLSDIVYFIQHKTKPCKINHKSNSNKENLLKCSNCSESFKTADSLLEHAQFYHNINIFIQNNKTDQKADLVTNLKSNNTTGNQEKDLNKDQIFIDVIPSDSNSIFLDHSKSYNITFSSSNADTSNKPEAQVQSIERKSNEMDHNESTNSSCDSTTQSQNQKSEQLESNTSKTKDDRERTKKQKAQANFFCDVCNAAFNQKIHLTKHSAKHTGIKPFKCTECNYSTVERSHLKVHVRVHTGEKPFKCTFCEYATAQSSTLKIHKKRHHDKIEINQTSQPASLVENESQESKPLIEVKKSQLDFKNLPPTKRFKNISELESLGKTAEQTKEENKLLGLANIALEREVDTKPLAK